MIVTGHTQQLKISESFKVFLKISREEIARFVSPGFGSGSEHISNILYLLVVVGIRWKFLGNNYHPQLVLLQLRCGVMLKTVMGERTVTKNHVFLLL